MEWVAFKQSGLGASHVIDIRVVRLWNIMSMILRKKINEPFVWFKMSPFFNSDFDNLKAYQIPLEMWKKIQWSMHSNKHTL